jgi:hypothetical protein
MSITKFDDFLAYQLTQNPDSKRDFIEQCNQIELAIEQRRAELRLRGKVRMKSEMA